MPELDPLAALARAQMHVDGLFECLAGIRDTAVRIREVEKLHYEDVSIATSVAHLLDDVLLSEDMSRESELFPSRFDNAIQPVRDWLVSARDRGPLRSPAGGFGLGDHTYKNADLCATDVFRRLSQRARGAFKKAGLGEWYGLLRSSVIIARRELSHEIARCPFSADFTGETAHYTVVEDALAQVWLALHPDRSLIPSGYEVGLMLAGAGRSRQAMCSLLPRQCPAPAEEYLA